MAGNEDLQSSFPTEWCLDVILNLLKVSKKKESSICLSLPTIGIPHLIYKAKVPINLKSVLLEDIPSPWEAAAFLLALGVGQVFSAHTLQR